MIRRRRPISPEEILERLQRAHNELSPHLAPIPSDLSEGITLIGTLTLTDLYAHLGAPQGWSLHGYCDLVGGFAIGDERASASLDVRRRLSLSNLGTALARFVTAHNRPIDLDSEVDRNRLFQILESPSFGSRYPLVEHIGQSLATGVLETLDQPVGPECLEFDQVMVATHQLNEQLHRRGFDRLWNDAFSALE